MQKNNPDWTKNKDVINFSVVSDGKTDLQWFDFFEKVGLKLDGYVKKGISLHLKPTKGVITKISVIGFNPPVVGEKRTTAETYLESHRRNLDELTIEEACLVASFPLEKIKKMGLWWIVPIHEFHQDFDRDPNMLFKMHKHDSPWLRAYYRNYSKIWDFGNGFAFADRN